MGPRHTREDMLRAALDVTARVGFGCLSFGRVAKELGTSDRMVVYYFPSKADLITEVAAQMGSQLQALLDTAFGSEPQPVDSLMSRAWPILTAPDADPVFAAYLEIVGLAAAGQEPYTTLAPRLIDAWVQWLAPRVAAPDPTDREGVALAAIAQLDGLLLIRHARGPEAADLAARHLGIS